MLFHAVKNLDLIIHSFNSIYPQSKFIVCTFMFMLFGQMHSVFLYIYIYYATQYTVQVTFTIHQTYLLGQILVMVNILDKYNLNRPLIEQKVNNIGRLTEMKQCQCLCIV